LLCEFFATLAVITDPNRKVREARRKGARRKAGLVGNQLTTRESELVAARSEASYGLLRIFQQNHVIGLSAARQSYLLVVPGHLEGEDQTGGKIR
jgi:hypothetical protein